MDPLASHLPQPEHAQARLISRAARRSAKGGKRRQKRRPAGTPTPDLGAPRLNLGAAEDEENVAPRPRGGKDGKSKSKGKSKDEKVRGAPGSVGGRRFLALAHHPPTPRPRLDASHHTAAAHPQVDADPDAAMVLLGNAVNRFSLDGSNSR